MGGAAGRDLVRVRPLLLGLLALGLGVLVYALDRPPDQVYFLPAWLARWQPEAPVFGALGAHLPTFFHPLGMALLTLALLPPGRRSALAAAALWALVDAAFELGQHPALGPALAARVPSWFQGIPVLENTRGYFLNGRFDPWDLAAIFLGAAAAYALGRGAGPGRSA